MKKEIQGAQENFFGHDRILVSLASAHYINQFIKENKKLTVNIVDEKDASGSRLCGICQR